MHANNNNVNLSVASDGIFLHFINLIFQCNIQKWLSLLVSPHMTLFMLHHSCCCCWAFSSNAQFPPFFRLLIGQHVCTGVKVITPPLGIWLLVSVHMCLHKCLNVDGIVLKCWWCLQVFSFFLLKRKLEEKKTHVFKNTLKRVWKGYSWAHLLAGQLLISNLGAAKEFILCI